MLFSKYHRAKQSIGPRLNNAHLLSVTDEVNEEDFVPASNVSPKATLSIDAREVQSEDFEELARQTTATNQRMILESTSQGHDDATMIDDLVAQPFVLNPGDQTIVQVRKINKLPAIIMSNYSFRFLRSSTRICGPTNELARCSCTRCTEKIEAVF
jgi:hypothetical protein